MREFQVCWYEHPVVVAMIATVVTEAWSRRSTEVGAARTVPLFPVERGENGCQRTATMGGNCRLFWCERSLAVAIIATELGKPQSCFFLPPQNPLWAAPPHGC